jgi:hypothetical protein
VTLGQESVDAGMYGASFVGTTGTNCRGAESAAVTACPCRTKDQMGLGAREAHDEPQPVVKGQRNTLRDHRDAIDDFNHWGNAKQNRGERERVPEIHVIAERAS